MNRPPVTYALASRADLDLVADGVRIRVRPPRRPARFAGLLTALAVPVAAGFWSFDGSALSALTAALVLGAAAALLWCLTGRSDAYIAFDRHAIHDAAGGLPPIPWSAVERLEVVPDAPGGSCLFAHPAPPAARPGRRLPGTASTGLPIPFEYLVVLLDRCGAPVQAPDPAFDPFDCDARWLSPRAAADLIAARLGGRARPYAGQHLDLAETRGDRPGMIHWRAVSGRLRHRAGLVAAED